MYPVETLNDDYDNGTMPDNVEILADAVIGRKIISVIKEKVGDDYWDKEAATVITLDNGRRVIMRDTNDCCAHTTLEEFFLHPESVDHMILGVGTTDNYETWHIYADFGDVMKLQVGWSAGNPFYYGYGFDISVQELTDAYIPKHMILKGQNDN